MLRDEQSGEYIDYVRQQLDLTVRTDQRAEKRNLEALIDSVYIHTYDGIVFNPLESYLSDETPQDRRRRCRCRRS